MAKRTVATIVTCALTAAWPAPAPAAQADSIYYESRPAMGTTFDIYLYARNSTRAAELLEEAFAEIERIDALLSNYRPDSELSRVNARAGAGGVTIDPELFALLERAMELSRLTHGAFDMSVGQLMMAWGFFRDSGHYPSPDALTAARAQTGWRQVLLEAEWRTVRFLIPELKLDPGALGKGYALDRVAELLRSHGVERALIGSGTSSYYAVGAPLGKRGWAVHVRDPLDRTRVISTVLLRDRSLSTSGNYEKFFELDGRRYAHIIDPRTGIPVAGRLQVTVIAQHAVDSDALATALFVSGPDAARSTLATCNGSALFLEGDSNNTRTVVVNWLHPMATTPTSRE